MRYIINNVVLSINQDVEELRSKVARKLRVSQNDIVKLDVVKESIDARDKRNIRLVYSVRVDLERKLRGRMDKDVRTLENKISEEEFVHDKIRLIHRPVIVGLGPSGLFCGLTLARNGYNPIILEMGDNIENRSKKVDRYWKNGVLDVNTNVQFGEGGAGTFSDGKLTTRINDPLCDYVLEEFCRFGAPNEIAYQAKPHIGSDVLKKVIVNLRQEIVRLGGTVKFNTKLIDLVMKDNKLCSVVLSDGQKIDTSVLVLAIGHSSRDTFSMLLKNGFAIERKPFSIGLRIEHPQYMVNQSQYGEFANHPKLGNAIYQLYNRVGDRTAYSFCMCPGGVVVAAASEENTIVTNGMSNYLRNEVNANSAFVVSVTPKDFDGNGPLAGVEFQRKWERLAYKEGCGGAPIQTLGSFLKGKVDLKLGCVKPSYTGETRFADLNKCLPRYVTNTLKASVDEFSKKMSCFCIDDAILTGVETRTSSPIRIRRNSNFEADGIVGVYPCGEGAGYAGGIMSASVDGIKIAKKIISRYTIPVKINEK